MSGKYALIIGNTEYTDPGLAQLTAPGRDVEDFARVLKSADIAGFDNVITLMNENISKVNETVEDFFAHKKPNDLLVFYFSGHGVRDEFGALYLAIRNTNRARLRSTAIQADYVRESMDQSRSRRQVLILDCCNSGAFPQGTKAETGGTMGTATAFEGTGYGRVVLTASDATQFAWEGDKVIGETDNSLFTHFLVTGLEGEADQDRDGKITVDELYDYAYEQIVNITPKQTPGKWSYKQQGEIVLRQSTRMENIKPVSLPDQLTGEIENPYPEVRLRAVLQLAKLVSGKHLGFARSAREALERIEKEDDSRRVAQAATQILESLRQAELFAMQKAEEERKAHEEAEAERIAIQKAEEKRIAREKTQQEKLARERAEEAQLAAQKVEAERVASEQAERERLVQEKAEAERLAEKKAEEERIAQEKIARERLARQKAEREAAKREATVRAAREAAEKAEQEDARERQSAEQAAGVREKTASPNPTLQRQPVLKWAILGIIGICVFATAVWGIPYLASLGVPAPTEGPQTKAPATDIPMTKEIATERTNTRVPIPTNTPYTLPIELIISFEKNGMKKGLALDYGGDVDTQTVTVGGSQALSTGNGKALPSLQAGGNLVGDSYMQFGIDDNIMYTGKPTTFVQIEIEYFDRGKDAFFVAYDAMGTVGPYKNGKFTETCKFTKGNTLAFQKAFFVIKDARFANRDNGMDFRIDDNSDGPEIIRLVRVTLLPSLYVFADACGLIK